MIDDNSPLVLAEQMDERIVKFADNTWEKQIRTSRGWEPLCLNEQVRHDFFTMEVIKAGVGGGLMFVGSVLGLLLGLESIAVGLILAGAFFIPYALVNCLIGTPKRRFRTHNPDELLMDGRNKSVVYDCNGKFVAEVEE